MGGKRGDEAVRKAIDEAFRLANASLRKEVNASFRTGSTAVIAVLLQRTLHVANCGDSRAVLCSGGAAHRLSFDHKPELPCERERIRKAGGQVTQVGLGPARVDGVLSVSRAFGDFMLAPRVTWHPYLAERRLTPADVFVVLGCDGVFDVLDDQTVVDIGREALDAGKTPAVAARPRLPLPALSPPVEWRCWGRRPRGCRRPAHRQRPLRRVPVPLSVPVAGGRPEI